jgi:hypothetical protein
MVAPKLRSFGTGQLLPLLIPGPCGNSVVSFGWDPRLNKVLVQPLCA